MLSVYLYKRLFPIKHLFANSTALDNYLYVNCYSRSSSSSSLVNVDLSIDKRRKSVEQLDEEKSFTVSYLMNSHGFSRERAVSISATAHFSSLEKPNSVLSIFKSYGFDDTQIAALVRKRPTILIAKQKTISPKLDFFLSVGMSKPCLATFMVSDPAWLLCSLNKLIIPNYNFLKSMLLSDERVINAIKRNTVCFREVVEKNVVPNIKVLRKLGVPQSCINLLLQHFPEAICIRRNIFQESVSKVLEMGFDPLQSRFVVALHVISGKSNKATWDQCYETYTSWGWSKEDIYMAFRKYPNCMLMSRNKIDRVMDFLVNKIGMNSRCIAENPVAMSYSLEKRIIPRLSVVQVLLAKGLTKHFSLRTVLGSSEKYFLNKFVVSFEKEIHKLYDLYIRKVGAADL